MNNLILKTLAAAVAMGCAGAASALPLTTFNEGATTQVTLRSAGSTAHDPGLLNMMRVTTTGFQFCAPGTLDHYQMNGNLNIYFCSAGANSGFSGTNRRIAILRNGVYGSGSGVSNLVRGLSAAADDLGNPIFSDFPDVTAGSTVSAAATATVAASGQLGSYVVHGGVPALTTTAAADIGITDEEPALFRSIFNPDVSAADLSKLSIKGISGVIFGTPVTRNVYARLQALQFPSTSACHPLNAGYGSLATGAADAANSEACMPSLSREQAAAIFKGDIADWTGVVSANEAGKNVTNVLADSAAVGTLTDSTIYVERRVPTSGTQLAAQVYFVGQGCSDNAGAFVSTANNGARVVENGGSGNVRTGLTNREAAGKGAVGVLSTESATVPGTSWRFVKINGYAPSLLNVVKGNYDFFYESSLQYRSAAVGGQPLLGTNKRNVANQIAVLLGNPTSLSALNSGFSQVFGARGGLVANAVDQVANAAVTPYAVPGTGGNSDVNVRPVATSTRGPGGVPDSCLTPSRLGSFQVGN